MKASRFALLSIFLLPLHALPASSSMLDPAQLAYNLETTTGAYEKIGRTNPVWDADAKRCLTAFAHIRSITNGVVDDFMAELAILMPRLIEKKCDDPLVRYLHLRFVFSKSHSASENAVAYEQ
jgi:hypothetical protein